MNFYTSKIIVQKCHFTRQTSGECFVFLGYHVPSPSPISFFLCLSPHSSRVNYSRNGYRWCVVIRKPGSAWLKGTPAIQVKCLYVSWYVREVDTHSISKYYFLYLSDYERATAWLLQVKEIKKYCVTNSPWRRSRRSRKFSLSTENNILNKMALRYLGQLDGI